MHDFTFTIESEINSTKEILWKHITQMKNINVELSPFMKMTYPEAMSEIGEREVPLNEVLFKSLILLFGFTPIDLHHLRLDKIDFGTGFYENSYSLHMSYWKHTRTISERNKKVFVRDEIHFSPRVSFVGFVLLPFFKNIFKNRHKVLQKHFSTLQR